MPSKIFAKIHHFLTDEGAQNAAMGSQRAMLEAGARAFINSPRGVLAEANAIKASSIYDWFRADFGGSDSAVIAHMKKYAEPALQAKLDTLTAISSHDYDWTLADAK